jgi:2-keto-4-pentenoate hydratase/2-oxohepta-3-ene-1,7-dioic acid hydratase in catechol pathway
LCRSSAHAYRVFKDHHNLSPKLKLNGELLQNGNARDMIFNPEEQTEYASRLLTLEPGDVLPRDRPKATVRVAVSF